MSITLRPLSPGIGALPDGDLPIWDNCCSVHGRTDFPMTERRRFRRTAVVDTGRPF